MTVFEVNADNLDQAISDGNERVRNRAFQLLYQSLKVKVKIREWMDYYSLKDRTHTDILQEAIILLDETVRNGRFRGECRIETFLLGICKNMIRDGGKKASKVTLAEDFDINLTNEEDVADHLVMGDESQNWEKKRDNELQDGLGQLTEKCQESLRLYYYDSQSMANIAKARGLADADQAKKAVHRCRESLRKILTENTFFHTKKNWLA